MVQVIVQVNTQGCIRWYYFLSREFMFQRLQEVKRIAQLL